MQPLRVDGWASGQALGTTLQDTSSSGKRPLRSVCEASGTGPSLWLSLGPQGPACGQALALPAGHHPMETLCPLTLPPPRHLAWEHRGPS